MSTADNVRRFGAVGVLMGLALGGLMPTGGVAAGRAIIRPAFFTYVAGFSGAFPSGDGFGILQVRRSATAALVSGDAQTLGALGVAAYGNGRELVTALPVPGSCATQLYQLSLSRSGRLGKLTKLGRVVPGAIYSLAASANGTVVAFSVRGCVKGQPGFLEVLNTATGRAKRWSRLNVEGVSPGTVAIKGGVSMSADGRLVAFTGWDTTPSGKALNQVVRVLRTSQPAGTVAARSRVLIRTRVAGPDLDGVSLSRNGGSSYVCSVTMTKDRRVSTIDAYATATGKRRSAIAVLRANAPTFPQLGLGCPMTLSTTGWFLLVPYSVVYPKSPIAHPVIHVATIDLATGRGARLAFQLPSTGGIDEASTICAGW
jgi:hypothetical protein